MIRIVIAKGKGELKIFGDGRPDFQSHTRLLLLLSLLRNKSSPNSTFIGKKKLLRFTLKLYFVSKVVRVVNWNDKLFCLEGIYDKDKRGSVSEDLSQLSATSELSLNRHSFFSAAREL